MTDRSVEPYEPFIPIMGLCIPALEEMVQRIGPSFTYELTVGENLFTQARSMCRQISADAQGNPFAPYVNVRMDPRLDSTEWILEANGKRVGCRW